MPALWSAHDGVGGAVTDMSPPDDELDAGPWGGSEKECSRPGRLRSMSGAACRTRTDDLLFTRQLLYQLS